MRKTKTENLDKQVSVYTRWNSRGKIVKIGDLLEAFKGLDPIPGTFLAVKIRPTLKKRAVTIPESMLLDKDRVEEWIEHTDENPVQLLVLAVGRGLRMVDGKEEDTILAPGDVVYAPMLEYSGRPFIHGGHVAKMMWQRDIICKTDKIPEAVAEGRSGESGIITPGT